ncbi:MAG: fibronectin type III domain-containing protein [Burkholderiaceae bacterium]|jgi:hypothetical protein|nr:fibronectin type III domain-containing protein [Burkholderiaceae bacterium]
MHRKQGLVRGLGLAFGLLGSLGTAQAAELLTNGSFEQNAGAGAQGFAGWLSASRPGSQGGFFAQQGGKAAVTKVAVPAPPDGAFALMSDQPGPGSHVLYQDVAIPASGSVTLTGRVYVQSAARIASAPATLDHALVTPNQQVRIDIMDPAAPLDDLGAGVLANVFRWPATDTRGPSVSGSGYQSLQLDLSSYAGRTVRLRIVEVDNRQSLFFGVDALSIWSGAVPTVLDAPGNPAFFAQGGSVQLTAPTVASIPGQTVTGYVAQCVPQGGGAAVTATSSTPVVVVAGLATGVAYNCSVAAQSNSGTGPVSSATPVTVPASGATVSTPQGGVARLTVENPASGCTLQSATMKRAENLPRPPQGPQAYPLGVLDMRSAGCQTGATLKLNITVPQPLPSDAQYWKYGPTASNTTPHWYAFNGGFKPHPTLANTYTVEIQDGGLGDDDLVANGVVVDPGGIMSPRAAIAALPVPVWNLWGLFGTSGLMLLAMAAWRRRGARP